MRLIKTTWSIMGRHACTSIIVLMIIVLLPVRTWASVLFSDHFENSDWDGRTDAVSTIVSEVVGNWYELAYGNPSIGENNYCGISSTYGYGGTSGFGFIFTSSGGDTQYFNIQGNSTFSTPTLYWGYRMKLSGFTLGSNNELKLTRFYGDTPEKNHIIPDLYDCGGWPFAAGNQCAVWLGKESTRLQSGYFPGTDWRTYIWGFIRGTDNDDGEIHLWVDGVEVTTWYSQNINGKVLTNTNINFGDNAGGNFLRTQNWPNMSENLSGSYSGGSGSVYWDDIIFATTKAEVEEFLGIDSEAPSTPSLHGVSLHGVDMH